jgi:hypothetical protein
MFSTLTMHASAGLQIQGTAALSWGQFSKRNRLPNPPKKTLVHNQVQRDSNWSIAQVGEESERGARNWVPFGSRTQNRHRAWNGYYLRHTYICGSGE